jgi:hypothetical protein
MPSKIVTLTLRRLAAVETDNLDDFQFEEDRLMSYMKSSGSSDKQIEYWLSYSSEMSALPGESIGEIIETEVILEKLQGLISRD